MKYTIALALLTLSLAAFSQTPPAPQSSFADTTYSFGLTPITLPGAHTTLAGAESDILIHLTANNAFGPTTLISTATFVGGRFDHSFPSVANWLQNNTALTGYNYQAYVTASLGVVKGDTSHWGQRVGAGLRWAPAGSTSFSMAFEAQANNLPGISHWIPSVSITPQFRF